MSAWCAECVRKLNKWRPKKLLDRWTVSESGTLKKYLIQNQRDASGPLVDPSTTGHQKWSPWKGGCQQAIVKEGKQGEKAELCQITQEVDWKSLATVLMEGWILPRARTSTLLKLCAVMLTENETKGSQHPKKGLQEAWRTIPEDYLKKWQKVYLRGFRLCWKIKMLIPNIDFQAC